MVIFRRPILILIVASMAIVGVKLSTTVADDATEPVRGMTISCHTWGWEWGTDEMVESMRILKGLGVNWITIHPYGGIRPDGTVSRNRIDPDNPGQWLLRPIREAHRLGLKIMIKPHLAHWGSGFSWRGAIEFDTDEEWRRFFDSYREWVFAVAEICHDADAFVVGTELDRTVQFTDQWRKIIAGVRERTNAPLTYAANWDAYRKVTFWDALDVIGIQAYFPIVNHDGLPGTDELEQGWGRILRSIEGFAKERNRKVVFCELGYNRSSRAAFQPWESRSGGPAAEETQSRCLTAALEAVENSDTVVGVFLWKWFPGEAARSSFLMSTEPMKRIIAEAWTEAARPTSQPDLSPG